MLLRAALCALALLSASSTLADPVTPLEHRRGPEQTYLTFPEWFLVFSPAEYAAFTHTESPSDFPFWGHIRQFWSSYAAVTRATMDERYEFNGGYHVMILVIGISTTVEYSIRSAYETVVGRLAELTANQRTAEDDYGARVAQEYVDFIRVRPWYEFDFWDKLKHLWRDMPMTGDGFVRKIERRYALTTEYLVKAVYGWLIGVGTHASYERPLFVTAVVFDSADKKQVLALLPRYEAFTPAVVSLATQGTDFSEVAGNDGGADILLSVIAEDSWRAPIPARVLFTQPILTQRGRTRVALVVPIRALAMTLRELAQSTAVVEHVFDY